MFETKINTAWIQLASERTGCQSSTEYQTFESNCTNDTCVYGWLCAVCTKKIVLFSFGIEQTNGIASHASVLNATANIVRSAHSLLLCPLRSLVHSFIVAFFDLCIAFEITVRALCVFHAVVKTVLYNNEGKKTVTVWSVRRANESHRIEQREKSPRKVIASSCGLTVSAWKRL